MRAASVLFNGEELILISIEPSEFIVFTLGIMN
jgi:hypothetical protein